MDPRVDKSKEGVGNPIWERRRECRRERRGTKGRKEVAPAPIRWTGLAWFACRLRCHKDCELAAKVVPSLTPAPKPVFDTKLPSGHPWWTTLHTECIDTRKTMRARHGVPFRGGDSSGSNLQWLGSLGCEYWKSDGRDLPDAVASARWLRRHYPAHKQQSVQQMQMCLRG